MDSLKYTVSITVNASGQLPPPAEVPAPEEPDTPDVPNRPGCGCGDTERNVYYAMTPDCIARYIGCIEKTETGDSITAPITYQDSLNYITDLVIDELALELAWEGNRFGDLVRFAKAVGDNNILAKRIAGREFSNSVTYRHPEFEYDTELYSKMMDEDNWYLPLPAEMVDPVDPENIPTGKLPNE